MWLSVEAMLGQKQIVVFTKFHLHQWFHLVDVQTFVRSYYNVWPGAKSTNFKYDVA